MSRLGIDPVALVRLAGSGREPHTSHQLVGTAALRSQALQLLLDQVRSGELDEREARHRHETMTTTKVRLLGDRVSRRRAWDLARRHDWPDLGAAEHLAVAMLQADALVALDPSLVAKAEGLVPVVAFEALFQPSAR